MVPHILFQEMIQMKEISGWLGGVTTGKAELKYSYLMSGGLCVIIGHTPMKPKWSVDSWVIVYKVSDMLLYQYICNNNTYYAISLTE